MQNLNFFRELKANRADYGNIVFRDYTPAVARQHQARMASLLVQAENFVLDREVDLRETTEVVASIQALAACGLLRLPAPVCYFEMPHFTRVQDSKTGEVYDFADHLCAIAVETQDNITVYPAIHSGWSRILSSGQHFGVAPHTGVLNPTSDPLVSFNFDDIFLTENPQWPDGQPMFDNFKQVVEGTRGNMVHSVLMVMFSIVMMNTRWVEKRPVSKGLSRLLKSRGKPSNGHIVICIQRHGRAVRDASTAGIPEEHLKVRLHLRRGHKRDQPYGQGRQLTKAIWIEPTLVGYAEEGVVLHDYRLDNKKSR